ncbi:unnamed protein product [Fusarium graminearum]|uniref:Uncharacterized protein n=1 Tax=Gibberella zeae TaxID=5518 RepID=A0A4E9EKS2_GIBZA|nr:unnamed protein product [Fusarium graminearum]CAF3525902.1 unnamed protein product [Fusarium graminearum]CAG1960644.1 unnamed protein product [Fusarium graminearum]CAG1964065.1 unnamed protein product [Fusarium graminearum]
MEKVWFKLRQTDYYPPPEDVILLGDRDDSQATIYLGQFISDLKRLNFPLNRDSINAPSIHLAASTPVLTAARITISTTFMQTVANHESYDRLDTYTV